MITLVHIRRSLSISMIALALLFSATTIQAASPGGGEAAMETTKKELRHTIKSAIEFPEGIYPQPSDDGVVVRFRIGRDNTLHVLKVEGKNPSLNRYVSGSLEGLDLDEFAKLKGRNIQLKISFRDKI